MIFGKLWTIFKKLKNIWENFDKILGKFLKNWIYFGKFFGNREKFS